MTTFTNNHNHPWVSSEDGNMRSPQQPQQPFSFAEQAAAQMNHPQQGNFGYNPFGNYPGIYPGQYPGQHQPQQPFMPQMPQPDYTEILRQQQELAKLRVPVKSKDIINDTAYMSARNYQALLDVSDMNGVNALYFSNADYVWRLFSDKLDADGLWFGKVFVNFNANDVLVLTTPDVSMQVSNLSIKLVYKDSDTKPLSKTQVRSGLIPILEAIQEVYTDDEEQKRLAEINRLKSLELEDESDENEPVATNPYQGESSSLDNRRIDLRTRKIKNSKSNYAKFIKTVTETEPSGVRYLYKNVEILTNLIRKRLNGTGMIDNGPIPEVLPEGIVLIDGTTVVIKLDGIYLDFDRLPSSPMLQYFEYADLRDPEIIKATINICKELHRCIPLD